MEEFYFFPENNQKIFLKIFHASNAQKRTWGKFGEVVILRFKVTFAIASLDILFREFRICVHDAGIILF